MFPPGSYWNLGLPDSWYGTLEWQYPPEQRMGAYEEEGRAVNHIKAGIITADRVVTVCVGVGGCGCECLLHQGRHYHGRPCCHGMWVWVWVWVSTTSRPSLSRQAVMSWYVCVWGWVWVWVSTTAGIITADRVVTVCWYVCVGGWVWVGVSVNVYHIKAGIITADRVVTVCVGVGRCGCGWV